MKFEEKLMTLRKAKGWSQEDLSNQIGVSRQTISKWESSQTTPEMNKLIELSRIFEISVDELINDVKEESKDDEKVEKVYTKINLKPTNILLLIGCVLIIIGFIFSIILYLKNKKTIYVEDVVMITYSYTLKDKVEVIEIYSFNGNDECIGANTYLKINNDSDYEKIVNDINKVENNEGELKYNITLNNNEITWSEEMYKKDSKSRVLEERKQSLLNVQNLKITDM